MLALVEQCEHSIARHPIGLYYMIVLVQGEGGKPCSAARCSKCGTKLDEDQINKIVRRK